MILETLFNYLTNNCSAVLASSRDITVLVDGRRRSVYDFLINALWSPIVD